MAGRMAQGMAEGWLNRLPARGVACRSTPPKESGHRGHISAISRRHPRLRIRPKWRAHRAAEAACTKVTNAWPVHEAGAAAAARSRTPHVSILRSSRSSRCRMARLMREAWLSVQPLPVPRPDAGRRASGAAPRRPPSSGAVCAAPRGRERRRCARTPRACAATRACGRAAGRLREALADCSCFCVRPLAPQPLQLEQRGDVPLVVARDCDRRDLA